MNDIINLQNTLLSKANVIHNHNDLYYTEDEIDEILTNYCMKSDSELGIVATPPSITLGSSSSLVGTLSVNNIGLKNCTIKIYENNELLGVKTTNEYGQVTYTYSNNNIGLHTIDFVFEGNSSYLGVSSSISVDITELPKIETSLTITSVSNSIEYNKTTQIKGVLKANGVGVSSALIKAYENNTLIDTFTTNTAGEITFNYSPSILGNNTILLVFDGDTAYSGCNNSTNILVSIITTTTSLETDKNILYSDETALLTSTTMDNNGEGVPNISIAIYEGSNELNRGVTGSNGVYTYTYAPTSDGSYNLKSVSSANTYYASSQSTTKNITYHSKYGTVLTLSSSLTTLKVGESVTLTANLKDNKNNPVSGVSVKFMNGTTELRTATTNNNGVAVLNYTCTVAGVINSKAVFNGNDNYSSSISQIIAITVNPALTWYNLNSCAFTYTETDGVYDVTPCYNGSLINSTNTSDLPLNNFELKVKIKKPTDNYGYHGIGILNGSTNQLLVQGAIKTQKVFFTEGTYGTWQTTGGLGIYMTMNTWYTFKLKVVNHKVTCYIMNEDESTVLWSKEYGDIAFDRYGVWIRENKAYFKDFQLNLI